MSKIVARLWGSSKESVGSSGFGGKASAGSLTNSRGQNRLTTAKGLDKRRQALIDMITQSPSRTNGAPRHIVNYNKDPLGLGTSEHSMIKPKVTMGASKGVTAAIRTPDRTAAESILSPTKEFIKSAMAGNDLEEDIMDDSEQVQKAMRDVEAFGTASVTSASHISIRPHLSPLRVHAHVPLLTPMYSKVPRDGPAEGQGVLLDCCRGHDCTPASKLGRVL